MCHGCCFLVAVSMWLQYAIIWENPGLSWASNVQLVASVAKGKGLLEVRRLEEAGGINNRCFLRPLQFASYFVSFHFFPPSLALTDKEKTWDNLLDKSCLEVASAVLNTWCAENHAGKIQVYYSIRYFTSVKEAGLSEGRDWPALGSLLRVAFASGRRLMWNMLLSSVFSERLSLLRMAATNLHPGSNCWAKMETLLTVTSTSWNMYCIYYHVAGGGCKHIESLPVTAERVIGEDAALGPRVLFPAFAETGFVPWKALSEVPEEQSLKPGICMLPMAPPAHCLNCWRDERRRCFCSVFPHLQSTWMWQPFKAITGLGLQMLGLFVTRLKLI